MARVTVEDCLQHMDNRFDMTLLAARRARQIALGNDPLVEANDDKPTVIALREIAEGKMNPEIYQKIEDAARAAREAAAAEEAIAAAQEKMEA